MKVTKMFYGWWLVLVCLVIGAIAAGVITYSLSLVAGAMDEAFAASRPLIMLGISGHSLMTGILAPYLAGWMERISVRKVVIISSALSGIGFLILAASSGIWGYIGVYTLLIPAGSTCMMVLLPPILLSRWFSRLRGTAIGTACLGTQLGGFLVPPLVAYLFENHDWRLGALVMGVLVLMVPILAWRFIVEKPADRGLLADGDGVVAAATDDLPPQPRDSVAMVRDAFASREFWMAATGFALIMGMTMMLLSNMALFATDIGIPRERAALLISLYALTGMVCSPLVGKLCDLIDIRLVFAGILLTNILAMLIFAAAREFPLMIVGALVVGVSGGGFSPLWGSMLAKLFDLHIYARVVGLMNFFILSFAAATPLLSGWLYDLTGGYRAMFLLLAAALVVPVLYAPLFRLHRPATLATASPGLAVP